jgi:hypothetical protein
VEKDAQGFKRAQGRVHRLHGDNYHRADGLYRFLHDAGKFTVITADFYKNQNFADGFASVEALPFTEIKKLEELEGIARIQGRFVTDVRVLFPGREDNVYLRLIFLNADEQNRINDMLLLEGKPLQEGDMNILIDNKFYAANNLSLNDKLEIIAAGKRRELYDPGWAQARNLFTPCALQRISIPPRRPSGSPLSRCRHCKPCCLTKTLSTTWYLPWNREPNTTMWRNCWNTS